MGDDVIKVLVVDDSAVLRQSLRLALERAPELRIVGEARNGEEAVALTKRLKPDVVTMDIRMPKMDGIEAIRAIMAETPVPIVVVTSADLDREPEIGLQAKRCGAVSVLRRPSNISDPAYESFNAKLVEQVKLMSDVKVVHRSWPRDEASRNASTTLAARDRRAVRLIAIGASTGGPAALHRVVSALPADLPVPILVVQHMAYGFVNGLAEWLDASSPLKVKVAEQREKIKPGVVYLAPDDYHMQVTRYGRIILTQGEPVNGHRPSITVLFESVAHAYAHEALALILTGMGSDGVAGMQALREAGTITIAQDEKSCVVFGMPKEAIAVGAVDHVMSLEEIAQTMVALCRCPSTLSGQGEKADDR